MAQTLASQSLHLSQSVDTRRVSGSVDRFCVVRNRRRSFPSRSTKNASRLSSGALSNDELSANTVGDKDSLVSQFVSAIEQKDSENAKGALEGLKDGGHIKLWNSYPNISRRNTYIRELSNMGIKNPENLATPSDRNNLAFLVTVVGSTSLIAVIAGQLPGDWGFFIPYLVGGISLAVLAVGSVAPGLLEAATDAFSQGFPDTKERVLRHEAAHFLVAYLLGLPVVGYSLDLGSEHVNLMDEKLQKRIYQKSVTTSELDKLAVVSMAGLAAEGLAYEKVIGQTADLFSLQRLINRSKPPLSKDQQQNLTRWAVLYAATLLKSNDKAYDALQAAMKDGLSVSDCVKAIESA